MTKKTISIGATPSDAQAWIKRGHRTRSERNANTSENTARLNIEVTPALRQAIKLAAFTRGITVAKLLRHVLEREFAVAGEPSCQR